MNNTLIQKLAKEQACTKKPAGPIKKSCTISYYSFMENFIYERRNKELDDIKYFYGIK